MLSIASEGVAEVKIAILDSGCNIEHEEGISFVDSTVADSNGHGTAIAEIVKEINPNAELYIAKVFTQYPRTVDITPLAKGIYWAMSHQVDLVSVSWETHMDHKAIHDAIQKAYNQGILVVAPAGNKGDFLDVLIDELYKRNQERDVSTVKYPAKYDEVVAVGAINTFWRSIRHPKYSAVGPEVEFVCDGSHGSQKGTSFAAARATAIIAKIKADHPDLDGPRLREMLKSHSRDLGDKGRDIKFGHGKLEYEP
jgi:subtilisin